MTAETYSNLLPHFIERRYCFGGAGFPRDSGVGGAKPWYRSVCIERFANLEEVLLRKAIVDVFEERERVP